MESDDVEQALLSDLDDDLDDHHVDHGAREGAFAVTPVPEQLLTEDPHNQGLVHEALRRVHIDAEHEHLAAFNRSPVKLTQLTSLRSLFDRNDRRSAIRTLTTRRALQVNDEFKMDIMSPDVCIRNGPHYLDYSVHLGNRRGLDAALSAQHVNHTLTYKITLSQAQRQVNIQDLPFNPKGRLLYIGTRGDEGIYLAMVPKAFFVEDQRDRVQDHVMNSSNNAMSAQHSLMMTMFIADVLQENRFQDMHCLEKYPVPLTREAVRTNTDIL